MRAAMLVIVLALAPAAVTPADFDGAYYATGWPAKTLRSQQGRASYYASAFDGRETASGERYDASALTAAHRTLPMGAKVRVVENATRRSVVVRINDRGPYVRGRDIDLSRRAALALGITDRGVADVTIQVVALPD